eukprot:6179674-Pleurochrysis_carterae.AAC.1
MQEHELRKGSVQRCGAKGPSSHWLSATDADPAASSGIPPEIALDCKPVRGNDTGVTDVSTGDDALSASLPPGTFASRLPPEASTVHAQRHRVEEAVRSHN